MKSNLHDIIHSVTLSEGDSAAFVGQGREKAQGSGQ